MELNELMQLALETHRVTDEKEKVLITAMESAYLMGRVRALRETYAEMMEEANENQ